MEGKGSKLTDRAGEATQWVRTLAAKPNDLNLTFKTYMTRHNLCKLFSDLHAYRGT